MQRRLSFVRDCIEQVDPECLRRVLFGLLIGFVVLFPLGKVFQVGFPLLMMPPLMLLYLRDWDTCTLRRISVRYLFVILLAVLGLNLALSFWPERSWDVVSPNLYRGFVLPFAAMECVRTEKHLRQLVLAFVTAVLVEGLDGIWQFVTGYDLIKQTPIMSGRLTGSMGTYRVGNYMGIACLPALGLFYLLPVRNFWYRVAVTGLILSPALFLWVFAQARMGYLALVGGLYLLCVFVMGRPNLKTVGVPLMVIFLLLLFGPDRISLNMMLADGRVEIWSVAWQTFLHHPWFGTGAGSYVPALIEAGLDLPLNGLGVQHPHNMYLQMIVDGGVVGFSGMMVFLIGMSLWGLVRIWNGVKQERSGKLTGQYWHLAAFFWAGWVGYLIVGFGGHDFYRTWFLATGMTMLGIMLGACGNGSLVEE